MEQTVRREMRNGQQQPVVKVYLVNGDSRSLRLDERMGLAVSSFIAIAAARRLLRRFKYGRLAACGRHK